MNRRPKNGDILEIPLLLDYGYGYAKFLNSKKIWNDKDITDVLRVFNYTSPSRLNMIDDITRELLIAPVALAGASGIYSLGWKTIGNEPIKDEDKFLPDVKTGWPPLLDPPQRWAYYEDLGSTTKMHFSEFHKVSHLEYSNLLNIEIIPFRITMEILKLENKDIKKMMPELDFLEEVQYRKSFDTPSYSKIPPEYRGRAKK